MYHQQQRIQGRTAKMIEGLEAFLWKYTEETIDFRCGKLKAKQGCLKKMENMDLMGSKFTNF